MTTTTSEPPTDSIFSAMSDASPSPTSTAPMLGMLVDRTSFDETDDFGLSEFETGDSYIAGPPVKLKDGTVRRRLRWRPKSMAKTKQRKQNTSTTGNNSQQPGGIGAASIMTRSSSTASVNSHMSHSSKQSKRSMHSFASTETAAINNTSSNSKKMPLPRPNYPSHVMNGVATIGNEGDWVQARISKSNNKNKNGKQQQQQESLDSSSSSTVFAAADIEQKDSNELNTKKTKSKKAKSSNSSSRRTGLPPRFQQRNKNKQQQQQNNSNNDVSPSSTPNTAASLSPSNSSEDDEHHHSIGFDSPGGIEEPSPVPVLSGDEVEAERRVDLRIRRVPSTLSTQEVPAKLGDGVEPLSANELRPPEERQDQSKSSNNNNSIASSSLPKRNKFLISNASRIPPALKSVLSDGLNGLGKNKRGLSLSSSSSSSQSNPAARQRKVAPNSPASSSATGGADEIRFSMSSASGVDEASRADRTMPSSSASSSASTTTAERSSHKAHTTVPVDVDNGTFLEAEKNLKAIHEMASEHLQQGEYTEALEVFEEILRGQLTRYGGDHYRVGTALHNIGIVHMRRGDYPKAIEVYKEAVRVRKKALEPLHSDVAVSLAQLGVAYMESSKHRKAIGAFREALKIRRKCLGNSHPKVAKILNNIGCSLFELDELEVAKVAFEEALEIQRNLLRHPPTEEGLVSEGSLLSIASTQSNIASIKLYCGQYDEACVDLEEALLIQQCVLGDDHPLAKRTQESLAWMEKSRDGTNPAAANLLAQLTGSLSASSSRDESGRALSVFGSLEQRLRRVVSGLDVACSGWDTNSDDEEENPSASDE